MVKTRSTAKKCIVCYDIETIAEYFSCPRCSFKTSVCIDCIVEMLKLRTSRYSASVGHDVVVLPCPICRTEYEMFNEGDATHFAMLHLLRSSKKPTIRVDCDSCKGRMEFCLVPLPCGRDAFTMHYFC